MSESRIKRLWKSRISQQLSGFHISTCIAPTNQVDHQEEDGNTANKAYACSTTNAPPPALPQHHTPFSATATSPIKKLWRKPLPNDCPSFDFEISEKTIIEQDASLIIANKEIPTRIQSRHYENIPNLEAQLERACKNEKAVLLTKLLEKQRHQQKQCT